MIVTIVKLFAPHLALHYVMILNNDHTPMFAVNNSNDEVSYIISALLELERNTFT